VNSRSFGARHPAAAAGAKISCLVGTVAHSIAAYNFVAGYEGRKGMSPIIEIVEALELVLRQDHKHFFVEFRTMGVSHA
jgi:hypothetical protein